VWLWAVMLALYRTPYESADSVSIVWGDKKRGCTVDVWRLCNLKPEWAGAPIRGLRGSRAMCSSGSRGSGHKFHTLVVGC
jgi:hypothetical protein